MSKTKNPLRRWLHIVYLSLVVWMIGTTSVFADTPSMITNISANTVENQVVINLSSVNKATLIAPLEKGERRLLIDIKGASLKDLTNKDALLKAVETQLTDIAQITMDEFRGNEPLVRLTIKTKKPEIQGALIKDQGDTLVLQFVKVATSPVSIPDDKNMDKTTNQDNVSHSSVDPKESVEALPSPVLSAKTAVNSQASELERKTFEAESLRYQRNKLNDQVANLKILVDRQNAMIAHLKEEQEKLLKRDPLAREKEQIMTLQEELKSLQKSYDQMKQTLNDYRKEITSLETNLQQEQEKQTANQSNTTKSGNIAFSKTGDDRAYLLNTLASLTQIELNRLLDAEKAFREAKQYELKNELVKAEEKYLAAFNALPQVEEYALTLADLYIDQKKYDTAQNILELALNYGPDDMELLNELGKVALFKKNYDESFRYFKAALPTAVLSNYASTIGRMKKVDEAEFIYKLAISAKPGDSDLQFNLGNLYLNQKRFQEAQDKFSEALRLKPDFPEAHFHLGLAYAELGKAKSAIDEFNSYLKLMPQAPNKDAVKNYINQLSKIPS